MSTVQPQHHQQQHNNNNNNKITWSGSTVDAIEYLKKIKPYDGWSAEIKIISNNNQLVRLLRRNVPVTDTYFIDLHYDSISRTVVGILTNPTNLPLSVCSAQILIDTNGKPIVNNKDIKIISVTTWKPGMSPKSTTRMEHDSSTSSRGGGGSSSGGQRNNSNIGSSTSTSPSSISEEQNKQTIQYFVMAIVGVIVFRTLLQAFFGLYLLALPIIYFILVPNCPPLSSFDAKKELKRILRGHHLPENHPNKPKGFFAETLARVSATVAAELVTLPGYEITTIPLGGAAIIVNARVPTVKIDYYWIGIMNQWYYVYSKEYKDTNES